MLSLVRKNFTSAKPAVGILRPGLIRQSIARTTTNGRSLSSTSPKRQLLLNHGHCNALASPTASCNWKFQNYQPAENFGKRFQHNFVPIYPAHKTSLPPDKLTDYVVNATDPTIEIEVDASVGTRHCFLDTTLNLMLYDPTIDTGNINSNLSMVWRLQLIPTSSSLSSQVGTTAGPFHIMNEVTYLANTGGADVAKLSVGQFISQNPYIFVVDVLGTPHDVYMDYNISTGKYAIYFYDPSGNNAYLFPSFDPAEVHPRGNNIRAVLDTSASAYHFFTVRSVTI